MDVFVPQRRVEEELGLVAAKVVNDEVLEEGHGAARGLGVDVDPPVGEQPQHRQSGCHPGVGT